MLKLALFDLDDTLYPASAGLRIQMRDLIFQFVQERLSLSALGCGEVCQRLHRSYGSTLAGLRREYGIDPNDYFAQVYPPGLYDALQPDARLGEVLAALPLEKAILT